jgi:hypothetical protein
VNCIVRELAIALKLIVVTVAVLLASARRWVHKTLLRVCYGP